MLLSINKLDETSLDKPKLLRHIQCWNKLERSSARKVINMNIYLTYDNTNLMAPMAIPIFSAVPLLDIPMGYVGFLDVFFHPPDSGVFISFIVVVIVVVWYSTDTSCTFGWVFGLVFTVFLIVWICCKYLGGEDQDQCCARLEKINAVTRVQIKDKCGYGCTNAVVNAVINAVKNTVICGFKW